MSRPKVNPEVVALLRSLLADALTGDITDLFVLVKDRTEEYCRIDTFDDADVDELLHELGTAKIRLWIEVQRLEQTQH